MSQAFVYVNSFTLVWSQSVFTILFSFSQLTEKVKRKQERYVTWAELLETELAVIQIYCRGS